MAGRPRIAIPARVSTSASALAASRSRTASCLSGGGDLAPHWTGQEAHATLYDVDDEQDAFDIAVARSASTPASRCWRCAAACRSSTPCAAGPSSRTYVGSKIESSCYHHQCLDRLGVGLEVVARAEDGVVEAVEIPSAAGWFLGVQWHPEDTWATDPQQLAVLEALVEAARGRRDAG